MTFKEQYEKNKAKLLADTDICKLNRDWIEQILAHQEKKGKRRNGLPVLDEACYKTLLSYCTMLKTTNIWFENKPMVNLTKADIEKVYEDLEEGRLVKKNGEMFVNRTGYYKKIFKGYPFRLIKKDTMTKEVIEYIVLDDKVVRFIPEFDDAVKKLVKWAIKIEHKVLLQLLCDFGEGVSAILQLKKNDFTRQIDKETKEPEYLLVLRKEILKRGRTPRTEPNLFPETLEMLDEYLETLEPEDKLFNFGLRNAEKFFSILVDKTKTKIQTGEKPTIKDLRSSLACHLLGEDWTTDEIKARLGHRPSSDAIDCYVDYTANNKQRPKKKIYEGNLKKLETEITDLKEENGAMKKEIDFIHKAIVGKKWNRLDPATGKETSEEVVISKSPTSS